MTQWTVHGTRRIYESEWMSVDLDDVEIPEGERFEHHVVRLPYPSTAVVVVDNDKVLLMWRHRFTTDTWGWEIPAGRCEAGETAEIAAVRETEEETGYRVGIEPLITINPLNGISSHTTHIFVGTGATKIGEPDPAEAAKVEWVPLTEIPSFIRKGLIPCGITLAALATYLTLRTTWSGPPSEPHRAG
ncbi:NUDIX hydrolase [Lentzea nigeriaca]|uniref:NUDIX hydrolase n=1 Tax=Lentzea nigeriaca TaxID=1128665 RepID=UPI00195DEF04|nr:NUDIX hydrolase [Lentzea nigeriaca]MBM7861108.1 8-oxo-dGTP pyrophosphatase MutT (NUDIX family) [Lentzea nigeriaca]